MAIDDNTSYELTGYQVKDLAQKIRAKADSSSLASVATSGLYSDLTGAPTIPTVYNGTLTIQQNGTTLGTFSANQSSNETINITGGGSGGLVVAVSFDNPSSGEFSSTEDFDTIQDAYGDGEVVALYGGGTHTVSGVDSGHYIIYAEDGDLGRLELTFDSLSATTGTYKKIDFQEKLTAGTNISIAADGKTISATDTTYTAFTGATSSVAGAAGLVPAPLQSERNKVLRGDGTWGAPTKTRFWSNGTAVFNNFSMGIGARVTGQDIVDAISDGDVDIVWINVPDMSVPYSTFLQSWDTRNGAAKFMFATPDSDGEDAIEIYYADATTKTCTITHKKWQEELIAGTNITIAADGKTISATDTTYSNFTGATSSVAGAAGLVPAPAAGDQEKALHGDGTWKDTTAKLVEMSYGEANAWTKFISAYNAGSIVYCRASSNANPASGSQTRKAFMAYVNNAANPTSVEFQYVRSVSSKTEAQPVDQVYVYTLTNTNGGTWSVASRNMGPKIAAGTGINVSYSNGTYTISLASAESQGGASD